VGTAASLDVIVQRNPTLHLTLRHNSVTLLCHLVCG
jgi:hypothetical protein